MKKLTGFFTLVLIFCAMSLLPDASFGEEAKPPKTVVDFFLLLPKATVDPILYFPIKNRRQILKEQHKLLDIPHGYLEIGGEADSTLTICLFRKQNGSYLVASYYGGGENDEEPKLNFFEYRAGHLVKVKPLAEAKPLPVPFNKKWKYELPRIGTMITVRDMQGRRVYGLIWNRRRFEILKW